jgi:hypothetical protein
MGSWAATIRVANCLRLNNAAAQLDLRWLNVTWNSAPTSKVEIPIYAFQFMTGKDIGSAPNEEAGTKDKKPGLHTIRV